MNETGTPSANEPFRLTVKYAILDAGDRQRESLGNNCRRRRASRMGLSAFPTS